MATTNKKNEERRSGATGTHVVMPTYQYQTTQARDSKPFIQKTATSDPKPTVGSDLIKSAVVNHLR